MWQDVSYLRQFYETPLGHIARRLIRRRLRELWPETAGLRVLAIGYGTPFMRPFQESAERAVAVMPDLQGVTHWPAGGPSLVALGEEDALPFPDNAFDRVLLVHAVESSEQLRRMLREVWRVLAGEGRIVAVVPNRRGLWARLERTPFGHGQPYSQRQIDRLLRENLFVPLRSDFALYMPPSGRRFILGMAPAMERIGKRWLYPFGGVVLAEAEKQVYSGIPMKVSRVAERRRVAAGSSSANRAGLRRNSD